MTRFPALMASLNLVGSQLTLQAMRGEIALFTYEWEVKHLVAAVFMLLWATFLMWAGIVNLARAVKAA